MIGHSCKDPINCRHLCCKEGTKKPPTSRKPKKKVNNPTFDENPEEIDELDDTDIITLSTNAPVKTKSILPKKGKVSDLDKILADLDAMDDGASAKQNKTLERIKSSNAIRPAPTVDDFLPDVQDIPPITHVLKPATVQKEKNATAEEEEGERQPSLSTPVLSDVDHFDVDNPPLDPAFDFGDGQEAISPDQFSSPLRAYSPITQKKKRVLSDSPLPRQVPKKIKRIASSSVHGEDQEPAPIQPQSYKVHYGDIQIDVAQEESPLFQPASSQTATGEFQQEEQTVEIEEEDVPGTLKWLNAWLDENMIVDNDEDEE